MSGDGVRGRRGHRLVLALLVALLLVVATIAALRLQAWRQREEEGRLRQVHTLVGTVEQHPAFQSTTLGTTRRVWVYLPPAYAREEDGGCSSRS